MGLAEVSNILWQERNLLELLQFKLDEQQLLLAAGKSRWLPYATSELERVLDVLARCLEVALPAMAAGAPVVDVRPESVAREVGALGERQRLVEERDSVPPPPPRGKPARREKKPY